MDRSLVEGAEEFARDLKSLLKVSKSMQQFFVRSKDVLYYCILLGAGKGGY